MFEIYIPVVNNPEFIELQYNSFKKFCKDNWKMIIFNDAKLWNDYSNFNDTSTKFNIKKMCEQLGIEHHYVPNEHHQNKLINASERHCSTINWIWQNFAIHSKNPILIFDSDMFPIKEFSISRWDNFDCFGVLQNRSHLNYLWPNLFFFQPSLPDKETIDWNILVDGGINSDTGGKTHNYLKNHPDLKITGFKMLSSCNWTRENSDLELPQKVWDFLKSDIKNVDGKYWCEMYDEIFLHYRAGSNWENISKTIHQKRIESLKECLN